MSRRKREGDRESGITTAAGEAAERGLRYGPPVNFLLISVKLPPLKESRNELAGGHHRGIARQHVLSGRDVVLPQLVTVHDRAPDPALEGVAQSSDATYVGVALMVDQQHLDRLHGTRPSCDIQVQSRRRSCPPSRGLIERIAGHLNE